MLTMDVIKSSSPLALKKLLAVTAGISSSVSVIRKSTPSWVELGNWLPVIFEILGNFQYC